VTDGRRPRVVQVLEACTGGTARHLDDLLRALSPDEFDVRVVCSLSRGGDAREALQRWRAQGVQVHLLPMRRRPAPLAELRCVRALRRLLSEDPCDVLHLHSSKAGLIGRLAARGLDCRVLYSPHCYAFLHDWPWPLGAAFRGVERLATRWQDTLVTVGVAELELARREGLVGAGEALVIQNAIDVAAAGAAPRRPEAGTVGMIASLRPQKDPDTFLRAAERLVSRVPEARFLAPADGPLQARVREQARRSALHERLEFVSLEEVMERAAVAVLPSRWEGLPYTLIDAMGRGIPVVGAAIAPLLDRLSPIDEGLLFPPGDARGLADRLAALLAEPARAARLGERCRELVVEQHDLEDWGLRMRALYLEQSRR